MSATLTSIDEIDLGISVAYLALNGARESFERCPSGENQRLVDDAAAEVDRLLDQRLAASR